MKRAPLLSIEDIPDANAQLAKLVREKLGVKGEGLGAVAERAKIPAKLQRELAYAAEVEVWLGAPKLARQINMERVQNAHSHAWTYLAKRNPKRERERRWIGIAAVTFVNLAIFFSLLALFLNSQL